MAQSGYGNSGPGLVTETQGLFAGWSKLQLMLFIVALTLMMGWLDYHIGPKHSLAPFYLLPLTLAAWYVGLGYSVFIAALSVAAWFGSRYLNGDKWLVTADLIAWNCTARLLSYIVTAVVVDRWRKAQRDLQLRVRERTIAFERSQNDLLQSSEREQRRFGRDLHDGLCQHLAATALTCKSLYNDLAEVSPRSALTTKKLIEQLGEAVALARQTANGLDPAEMDGEDLMRRLEEFAATTSRLFNVLCEFQCDAPVLVRDAHVSNNLFRIAQEATRNAINHGQAKHVVIILAERDEGMELLIEDDGTGIPSVAARGKGMGLRIMPHRAHLIGASFEARQRSQGGTLVRSFVPVARIPMPVEAVR